MQDGKSWGLIRAEWERLTGDKVGGSTLPNRYPRVLAAISSVEDEHLEQLKASHAAIEAAMKAEMWGRVSKHMKENGVETEYQAAVLEKAWKKMKDGVVCLDVSVGRNGAGS